MDIILEIVDKGFPVAGAVGGAAICYQKKCKWYWMAGSALAGWIVGSITKRVLFRVLASPAEVLPKNQMPVSGPLVQLPICGAGQSGNCVPTAEQVIGAVEARAKEADVIDINKNKQKPQGDFGFSPPGTL